MKVIFLDNDGVICLAHNWGSRYKKRVAADRNPHMDSNLQNVEYRFDNFDTKAIEVLNEILKKTDAEIVVSSDWRLHATLEELGKYYLSQGIIKAPIAITSSVEDIDPGAWNLLRYRADLELERSIEILDWLDKHPEVTNWVAVDDLNMSVNYLSGLFSNKDELDKKPGLTNFVHTKKSSEGIKQVGIKDKILKYLI